MPAAYYMDEHVPSAVTRGLRRPGIDVLTVQEDGFDNTDDPLILDQALALGRLMFTRDTDFLVEVAGRQTSGEEFATVFYAHPEGPSVGRIIAELEYIAHAILPHEMTNALHLFPL
jgi:hypothetical protein